MAELYANHPTESFNLREFIDQAYTIFNENETDESFIRFVLTGEMIDDNGAPKQAFIDILQNAVSPDHRLSISRDYDSLLGISDKIMVDAAISVYSVPHPSYALKKSIHFKHPINYQGVSSAVL